MQTIFKKIKKNIVDTVKTVKKKSSKGLLKRVLGVMILVGLGGMLFVQNNVYAAVGEPTDPAPKTVETEQIEKIIDINEIFNFGLKFIYALLWPVLFIAGGALDNTWVYGSFLHLDASLWSLRNIMKNFANFALGFMVLFAIVKNLFSVTSESDGEWSPIKIIKKTLIAGVLIQMSWFLMAAVIDISTIMTYSIGGLPMTVLHNNPEYKDKPILGISANLDMNDSDGGKMELDYYSTYGDKKISLCRVGEVKGLTGQYILGRKKINIDTGSLFEEGLCTWGAWPYRYKEYMTGPNNQEYKENLNSYLTSIETGDAQKNVLDCNFIDTDPSSIPDSCTTGAIKYGVLSNDDNEFFLDDDGNYELTVDSLLEKSKGFVGPFITIYSSILDFSSIASSPKESKGITTQFFELLIKFAFAVALFFPLVALAAVLIARIGMLWLAIVISPILVLLKVFEKAVGDQMTGMFEAFSMENLIKLIFAPVFVVFAISMSLIFLTALSPNNDKTSEDGIGSVWLEDALGLTKTDDGYSAHGLVEMDLGDDGDGIGTINDGLDTFAWVVTNLFSVGIIWFFLFFAIKMTGPVGAKIGGGIQESMQKMMSNLPIVPIPGGGRVGLAAAGKGIEQFNSKMTGVSAAQEAQLRKSMPWLYPDGGGADDSSDNKSGSTAEQNAWAKYNKATVLLATGQAKTMEDAFTKAEFTSEQQTIINNSHPDYITNFNDYSSVLGSKGIDNSDTNNITTFSAEKYTSQDIESKISNKDGSWRSWAEGVVGGNVKVSGGETMVMVNKGTHTSPDFKLVDQDTYAKEYLGQTDDLKYDEVKSDEKIRAKIEKQYGDLTKLTENQKTNMEEHIKTQQRELIDRLKQIEDKTKYATTLTQSTDGPTTPATPTSTPD